MYFCSCHLALDFLIILFHKTLQIIKIMKHHDHKSMWLMVCLDPLQLLKNWILEVVSKKTR
jgi:hypothetical protein